MVEACGPVQISKGEKFYIDATRVTSNTAEMHGVIEALFWLDTCVERRTLYANEDVLITVDSLHVKGLIDEKFIARENRVLATLLCHMWKVTKQRVRLHIRWIRGHQAMWRMALLIAWQTRVHDRSLSIDGGDGAHCWRLGRRGFQQKSCEYPERNDGMSGSP